MKAIYARQSVDKKDSISIEQQIEWCQRKLAPEDTSHVYSDKGYSGSNLQRPEFQEMMEDIRAGKITQIIVYKLDRISRSVLDFTNLNAFLKKHSVSFISTQEPVDTSTSQGQMFLVVLMAFAQMERETIQQRIHDNYYARGERGMYLGGPPPFGFDKVDCRTEAGLLKHLIPNSEAPTLEHLFELYGNGLHTLGKIARTLNEENTPAPKGGTWDSSKISRILRNPVYVQADVSINRYYRNRGCKCTNEIAAFTLGKGCYLYGKREGHERKYTDVTGHTLSLAPHDGLISPSLFLQCQERLDHNIQIDNHRRSQITWLTGLIKCGSCGYSVSPKSSNHGRYTYLYCSGKANTGRCDVDGNLGPLSDVESIVEARIFHWARRYQNLRADVEVVENKERNRILVRMEEISLGIDKLVDAVVTATDMSAPYINGKISELEKERRMLEVELDTLERKHQDMLRKEIVDLETTWSTLDISHKNAIANLLITRISLSKDEIEIEWKYDFDL